MKNRPNKTRSTDRDPIGYRHDLEPAERLIEAVFFVVIVVVIIGGVAYWGAMA